MVDKKTEMSFGPAWIHALQDPGKSSSSNQSQKSETHMSTSSHSSVIKYRYTMEEMIAAYNPRKCRPPNDLSEHEECFTSQLQDPLFLNPLSQQEQELLSQNINCEFIQKKANKLENGGEYGQGSSGPGDNEQKFSYRDRGYGNYGQQSDGRMQKNSTGNGPDDIMHRSKTMSGGHMGSNVIGSGHCCPGQGQSGGMNTGSGSKLLFDRNNSIGQRQSRMSQSASGGSIGGGNSSDVNSRFGFVSSNGRGDFQRAMSYDESKVHGQGTGSANSSAGPIQKKLSYPKVTNPADLSDTLLPSWRTNKTTAQATGTSTTVTPSTSASSGTNADSSGNKPEWRQTCDSSKNWRMEARALGKKETDPDDPSTDPQAIEYLNRKRAAQTKVTNARFITRRDDMMDLFKKNDTFDSSDERDFFGNPLGSGNSGGSGNFAQLGHRSNTGDYNRKPPGMGRNNYGRDRQEYLSSDKWGNYNQKSSDRSENGSGSGQRFGSQYGSYNRYPSFNRNNSNAGGPSGNNDYDDYRNTGSDDDESRRNIPEWSKDDGSGFDFGKVGTFDDTGAFCEVGEDFGGALEPENGNDKNDNGKADEEDRPGSSTSGKAKGQTSNPNDQDEPKVAVKESVAQHSNQSAQVQSSANKTAISPATESDAKQFERITRSVAEIDLTDEELTADIINSIFKNDMISGNFEPEKDPFVNKSMFGNVNDESKGFFSDFDSQFAFGSPVKPSSLSHASLFTKEMSNSGPASSFVHQPPVQEKLADFERSPFEGPTPGRSFMPETDEGLLDCEWFYCDPAGRIQGPFKAQEMDDWYRNGFFSMDLMLRRATESTFKTLGELFDAYGGKLPFSLPRLVSPPPPQSVVASQPITQPSFGSLSHEHLDDSNNGPYIGFSSSSMSPGFIAKNAGQQYTPQQQQQQQQHKYPPQQSQHQNAPSPMIMGGPNNQSPQQSQEQRNQHDINILMSHFTETRIRGHPPPFHELSPFFRIPENEVHEQLNFIYDKFMHHRTFATLSDLDKQGAVFEKFVSLHQEASIRKQQQKQQQQQQMSSNFSQPDGPTLGRQPQSYQQIAEDIAGKPSQHHIRMQQQQHNEQMEGHMKQEPKQMPQINPMMTPRMSMPGAMSLEELEEMQKREAEEQYKKQQLQQHQQQQHRQQQRFPAQNELHEEDEGFQMIEQRNIKRNKKVTNDKSQKETKPAVQAPTSQAPAAQPQVSGGKVSIIQVKPEDRDDGVVGTEAFQQFSQEQFSAQQSGNQKQAAVSQKCVWGTNNTEDVSQESLSLTEIQRLQEEKEREELERRKKMNEQMALLAGANANNTTEGHFKWAHNWKDQSAGQKVKTLAEIQAEESEKAAIIREQQEAEAARRIAAGSGITPMSSIVAKAAGACGPAPGMPWGLQQQQQQRSNWNDTDALSRNLQMPMKMAKAAKVPADYIRQYLKSSPRNVIKLEEHLMMKCPVESIDDLCRCSIEILEKAFDNINATAFINIAKDASTANEFVEYVQYYLGQNESARAFSKFFVNKKIYLNKKPANEKLQQQSPAHQQQTQQQLLPQQSVKKNMWDEESTSKATNKQNYAQQRPINAQKVTQPAQQMVANPLTGDFDIMNQNTETMKEFDDWCVEVLHQIDPVLDAETFVNFLKEIDSPDEIGEYVRGYLGANKQSRDFTRNFLMKRSYLRNKNRDDELDEDLCAPAQALTPGKSDDSGFVTVNNNGKKKRKPKTAGKENSSGSGSNLPTIRTITLD